VCVCVCVCAERGQAPLEREFDYQMAS
jgi:hypothetical protein